VAALRVAHPYEEPAFDVFELASWPGETGTGRVGVLDAPMALREFASLVGSSLPSTSAGGRVAGSADQVVRKVAVCGGSGGSLLAAATASGADVFVTSDLRHHVVSEHLAEGGCAVVDMPHWATEWPWLPDAAARLRASLEARGTTVGTEVSVLVTDPWNGHIESRKDAR
jgi:putative NIF3 family GTP cyclohydrolase 1 type 2